MAQDIPVPVAQQGLFTGIEPDKRPLEKQLQEKLDSGGNAFVGRRTCPTYSVPFSSQPPVPMFVRDNPDVLPYDKEKVVRGYDANFVPGTRSGPVKTDIGTTKAFSKDLEALPPHNYTDETEVQIRSEYKPKYVRVDAITSAADGPTFRFERESSRALAKHDQRSS